MAEEMLSKMRKRILCMEQIPSELSEHAIKIRYLFVLYFKAHLKAEMKQIMPVNASSIGEIITNKYNLKELNHASKINEYIRKRLKKFQKTISCEKVQIFYNIVCESTPIDILYKSRAFSYRLMIDLMPVEYDLQCHEKFRTIHSNIRQIFNKNSLSFHFYEIIEDIPEFIDKTNKIVTINRQLHKQYQYIKNNTKKFVNDYNTSVFFVLA